VPTSRSAPASSVSSISIGSFLDTGHWGAYQKLLTLLAALAIIFDGFDLQILGFAMPSIMREWHLARAAFAPVAALGLVGMGVGSPLAGYCGDRLGRRITIIACVTIFGAATVATAFCHTLTELAVLRTIAGLGVGGALPNASALTAEFAPMRRRAMAVMLTLLCVPIGGMIAGLVAAYILPSMGWRTLYVVGGTAPLLIALLLLLALPESPRYLARFPERRGELIRLLVRMGHAISAHTVFDCAQETKTDSGHIRALFEPEFLRDTVGLWLAFFANLVGVYLVFSWLPAMLTAQGLNVATASSGLSAYNFGGIFGILICTAVVTALGSRRPLLWVAAGGAATALALEFVHIAPVGEHVLVIGGFGMEGFFANALQTTLYALAAYVYPTRIRATGIACAAGVGRAGGMLGSLGGAAVIHAGSGAYLAVVAGSMIFAFLGLAIVRRHYPARTLA
jgi:MFS transporter, AAHS family, 4-hydroxybenzoate transporter